MLGKVVLAAIAACLVVAAGSAAVVASTPAYMGRFGPPSAPARFAKPSAHKPRQLHPFSADDAAFLYGLRWTDWGHGTAHAKGKASVNDCKPNCAQGHFHHFRSARARGYRLRSGECYGKPARFYTRARLHFPAKAHLDDFTVKLITGCGTS